MITIKNFEVPEGLWWRITYQEEGWVGVELVGSEGETSRRFNEALRTIESITGYPHRRLVEVIVEQRPDINKEFWLRVYLSGAVRADQVEGLK